MMGGGDEHDYVNTNDGGSSTLRDEYMTVAVSGSDDGDDDDDDGGADGDYDISTIAGTPFNK